MSALTIIANLVWIFLGGGILIALAYFVLGLALCLTIIGIPFGWQFLKLGWLSLWPFGQEVVSDAVMPGCFSIVFNVLWIVVAGLPLALAHLGLAILLALTLIGIPLAFPHLKLAYLSLVPFGKDVRVAGAVRCVPA